MKNQAQVGLCVAAAGMLTLTVAQNAFASLGSDCVQYAWNLGNQVCMSETTLTNCFHFGPVGNPNGCDYICGSDQPCLENCLNVAWEYQWNVSMQYPVC